MNPNPNPNPSKSSSSSAATQAYTPLSPSPQETVELGTGRLINLISNAIRETSPPGTATAAYTRVHTHSRTSSVERQVGFGDSTDVSSDEEARTARLSKSRSPVDAMNSFEPVELDGVEIGDATAEILDSYADVEARPLTNSGQRTEREEDGEAEWAEYGYDWTHAVSIPVIRLPSVKEGISRFRSLKGEGSQRLRRGPSVRERFGSMRRGDGGDQWYGGAGGKGYQALGSSVEVGVY
jgi:hypothetical protein